MGHRETLWTWGSVLTIVLSMPSLHKDSRGRSPFWVAAFRAPDGRRIKKSTKTADRSKAMKMAVEWENLAKKGREGALVDSQARRVVAEIFEQATGSPLHFKSVEEYFTNWLQNKQGATKEATFGKYKQIAESFLGFMGKRVKSPLTGVTPLDVQKWRDSHRAEKRAVSTVNLGLTILSGAFERARELGYVPVNPCAAVDPLATDDEGGREPFTWEQVEKIADAAKGSEWEGVVWIAFFSGLRLTDITNLTWENLDCQDPERWWLRVKSGKTKSTTHTPIVGRLRAWFDAQRRGLGKAPLFPSLRGRRTGGGRKQGGLSDEFKAIMAKAGVRGKIIKPKGGQNSVESLSFHSFRHTFSTWLERNNVPEAVRMRLTGHATQKAHRNYVHSDPNAIWETLEGLERAGVVL
jgi:integrase